MKPPTDHPDGAEQTGWRKEAAAVTFARGLPHHHGSLGRVVLAEAARLLRSRLPRRGRLHGSGQLGHRPRGRREVWLHAAERHHDFESDGDPAPASVHQAGHRHRSRPGAGLPRSLLDARSVWFLWVLCEIAIAACDLAEVVGSAIGLQLLFGIPLVWGCVITALDVLVVLYLQNKGFRYIEALVITLDRHHRRLLRGGADSSPSPTWPAWLRGFVPTSRNPAQSGDALRRHRHPRRHGHAAQSLPALLHRADAQVRAARPRASARRSSSPPSTRPSR